MRKLSMQELHRLSPAEFINAIKIPITVVLDNVRSMYNVGAVFRTCDAYRVSQLLLCGITACPPHREIHKTALGAENTVSWKSFINTSDAIISLKNEGICIAGIEQTDHSVSLSTFSPDLNKSYALVFGNEATGLSDNILELLDFCIEIPQFGTKHSLNISVAAGIVLYHFGVSYFLRNKSPEF